MQQQLNPEQYYMVVDEQSTGPYTFEQVTTHPAFSRNTLVWKPGLDNWVAAESLSEFANLFVKPETIQTPPVLNQPLQGHNDFYAGKQEPEYPRQQYPEQPRNDFEQQRSYNENHFANNPQYRQGHQYHHHQNQYGYDYSRNNYNQYDNRYRPSFRTNWLPWAIVATVVGFFTSCIGAIFGIIGIVQANKANTLYSRGMDAEGDAANSNAKTMTIIGLIFAGIGIIILFWFGNLFNSFGNFGY